MKLRVQGLPPDSDTFFFFLTVTLLDGPIMELRIAKQPSQDQRAPRPAGLNINLITTIHTSKKGVTQKGAQLNTEIQNKELCSVKYYINVLTSFQKSRCLDIDH